MIELSEVKKVLLNYTDVTSCEIYYFGSRATNKHRKNSDLDLLIIDTKPLSPVSVAKIEEAFEESNIPFKIDLLLKSRITEEFYQSIMLHAVRIRF
jgi:predicted nucleotidyltransferase